MGRRGKKILVRIARVKLEKKNVSLICVKFLVLIQYTYLENVAHCVMVNIFMIYLSFKYIYLSFVFF